MREPESLTGGCFDPHRHTRLRRILSACEAPSRSRKEQCGGCLVQVRWICPEIEQRYEIPEEESQQQPEPITSPQLPSGGAKARLPLADSGGSYVTESQCGWKMCGCQSNPN